MGGELRRRSKKHKGGSSTSNSNSNSNSNSTNSKSESESKSKGTQEVAPGPASEENGSSSTSSEEQEETLWQTFKSHPLIQVVPFVMIPFLIYRTIYFIQLEHPEYLKPLGIHLRPALGLTEPRQLLIVGTISSGTVQITSDLHDHFGIEIGHETSDTSSYFVRDGTVSWFHAIRYLPRPSSVQSLYNMCVNLTTNMGFHPRMYRPSEHCSDRGKRWSTCWAKECMERLDKEWGCEYGRSVAGNQQSCETPFLRTLHQVRHPVSVIESLVAKFCQGGQLNGTTHPSFVKYGDGMFRNQSFVDYSCIEAASHYVLEYNYAMLHARSLGLIHGMYRVETTTPCDVAKLAGFYDAEAVLYRPHIVTVHKQCAMPSSSIDSENGDEAAAVITNKAQKPMVSTKHKINKGYVSLTWDDFEGGKHGSKRRAGDKHLQRKLKNLMIDLGYDPEEKRSYESVDP